MEPLVIYHHPCQDGLSAAWAVNKKYPNTQFVPSMYNRKVPNVKDRDVIIVDFSYPKSDMEKIIQDAKSVILLDHHVSAQKDLEGLSANNLTILFDMKRSGAGLAWDFFFPEEPRPWILNYVEDRDLWNWKLPDSKAINAAIQSYPLTFQSIDFLIKKDFKDLLIEGSTILRMNEKIIENTVKQHKMEFIQGHYVPVVNSTVLVSEIGEKLAEYNEFAVVYYDNQNERHWSFRSNDQGIDVSKIAEKFKGGGHSRSSGVSTPLNENIFDKE